MSAIFLMLHFTQSSELFVEERPWEVVLEIGGLNSGGLKFEKYRAIFAFSEANNPERSSEGPEISSAVSEVVQHSGP